HADAAADLDRVDVIAVEVIAVIGDLAGDAGAGDQVVHAVEAAQHRALDATGRTDHGGDLTVADGHVHAAHRLVVAVEHAEAGDGEDGIEGFDRARHRGITHADVLHGGSYLGHGHQRF